MKQNYLMIFVVIGLVLLEVSEFAFWANRFITGIYGIVLVYISMLVLIAFTTKVAGESFQTMPPIFTKILVFYWFYSLFIVIYGLIKSGSYWDYRYIFIEYIPATIVSLAIFLAIKREQCLFVLRFVVKILFPLALIISFFAWIIYYQSLSNVYLVTVTRMSTPLFFFILAFPFIKLQYRWLVILLSIICIISDLAWRANVSRILVCWIIVLFYYFALLKPRLINLITPVIFFAPLILLYLAIIGTLDIFQFFSEVELETQIDQANTRTFLYQEVFYTMIKQGTNFLVGGGASAGYQSFSFGQINYLGGYTRYGSEVGFLNILLKSGIIGVATNVLIIFIPAYFAINRSNNNFCKILGFYLLFLWLFLFLEHFQGFNVNYFFIYIVIGLCLSNTFRNLSNDQVKFFFNSI